MQKRLMDWLFLVICAALYGGWYYQHRYLPAQQASKQLVTPAQQAAKQYVDQPTSDYTKLEIQGFEVWAERRLLQDPKQAQQVKTQFDQTLKQVTELTTPKQLAVLRKIKIWLSRRSLVDMQSDGSFDISGKGQNLKAVKASGWYISGDAATLRHYGQNPDKANSVEIGNITEFLKYPAKSQLSLVLHELAHGYHYEVLGEANLPVIAAHQEAVQHKIYEVIEFKSGKPTNTYAAKNPYEYFAELSVAYLARNDEFPYDRSHLAEHDPAGYRLMQQVWGEPKAIKPRHINVKSNSSRR
jgi:hypothetical protein